MKKHILLGGFTVATLVLGWAFVATQPVTAHDDNSNTIVGAWAVDAVGAPYVPHQFTFNQDGTMLTTNPTNVQENPAQPHGGTNDSLGMGPWEIGKKNLVDGTFYQLNANADNHKPTGTLKVTYKIKVKNDTFDGTAFASIDGNGGPATLHGTRLKIDKDALKNLADPQ